MAERAKNIRAEGEIKRFWMKKAKSKKFHTTYYITIPCQSQHILYNFSTVCAELPTRSAKCQMQNCGDKLMFIGLFNF